jgi:hypothetical protein
LGKRLGVHLDKARQCEEKAAQHCTAAGQLLLEAQKLCNEDGFTVFKKKFCPNLGRSRAYELLAIANGKKSIEGTKAGTRERVARHRASKAASVTVTDSTPRTNTICNTEADPDVSATKRKEEYAAAEGADHGDEVGITPRSAIRDLILKEFFAQVSGAEIYDRIPTTCRAAVIGELLDRLTVAGMLGAMSPEFGRDLRSRVPEKRKTLNLSTVSGNDAGKEPRSSEAPVSSN